MAVYVSRTQDFSDLDLDFLAHPTTKDVVRKTGVDAIKRSVRNLILTNFYDRPFRSYIGSNAVRLLFEPASSLTANHLTNFILEVINNNEPRVTVTDVNVQFDYDNNGYNATIRYVVNNTSQPVVATIFLERIR
jgi:phage baseplate assembly protein W